MMHTMRYDHYKGIQKKKTRVYCIGSSLPWFYFMWPTKTEKRAYSSEESSERVG